MSENTAEKIEVRIQEENVEQPIRNKEEVEVEVVDDTPPEDRNRPKRTEGTNRIYLMMMKSIVIKAMFKKELNN